MRIRIGINADPDTDPDPAFFVNADPAADPGFWWPKNLVNLQQQFLKYFLIKNGNLLIPKPS